MYRFEIKPEFNVSKNSKSLFERPYSFKERDLIIDIYSKKNGVNAFNGQSIRLDNIKNIEGKTFLEISMIDFFDFLTTTMVYKQKDSLIKFCVDHQKDKEKDLIENYCQSIDGIEVHSSFEDIINQSRVSNIIAVSILIEDKNGDVGLIHRTKKVAVSSGIFGVTATGSLDEQDYIKLDPFLSCAKRELKEELNISAESIHFDELVMSKQKLQPIALFSLKLKQSWNELIATIKVADDFNNETQDMYAVPVSVLPQFLASETFTEAASYQIYQKVKKEGFEDHIVNSPSMSFNKNSYLL